MNRRISVCALLLCALPSLAADPKKPPTKAPAKPPAKAPERGVKGTTQMAGDEAKIGTAYTIGKDFHINFTLDSAEFRVERVNISEESISSKADEKLLVLNYTVHNPNKEPLQYDWGTLKFTAVDAQNVNRESEGKVGRIGTNETVALELKPAQKLSVFTVIIAPAKGVIPKLIVQHNDGGPVLRYDLRKTVKGVTAPYANTADASGATVRPEVTGEVAKYYPLLGFDAKLISTEYAAGPLGEHQVEEGKRFFVATVSLKNSAPLAAGYEGAAFAPVLIDADGESIEMNGLMLKAKRDEGAIGELKPGAETTVRFVFQLSKTVAAKTLKIAEGESRVYAFDVSNTK